MEKSRNRAVGRQARKMIAAAMAAMLVFTSANVADVNAEETVLAVSENAVTGETGAGVVEAEKNTGEPEVENGGAENREAENTDLDAETADGTHTYKNGFCTDSGCSAYEPAVLTTGKYDIDANGEITDSDEAYEIGNAGQLYWFAGLVNGTLTDGTAQNLKANAVLTADIIVNKDLLTSINTDDDGKVTNGTSFRIWLPMGKINADNEQQMLYAGIFDGKGHSISGLYANLYDAPVEDSYYTSNKNCAGLFGYHAGVTRNLGIMDSYIRGEMCVGGICAYNDAGTIQNCYSTATVYGESYLGGICGRSRSNSIIENCYNAGYVYGAARSIGGICGDNYSTIESCYNIGIIEGNFMVGGIVGGSSGSGNTIWIKDCYNRGNVIGDTKDIGGIGGYIGRGLVENCYSQATVSGNTNVGGICGNGREDTFHNTYYDSNLYVGDAIGYKEGALTTEKTEGKPSQAFESGEIAHLLQADREEPVWGQTLSGNDVQVYPVLGGEKVYQITEYKGCIESTGIAGTTYNNANAPVFGPHVYENGFCTICSAYEPAVLTTGKYDIDANGEITDSDEAYEIGNAGQLYWFAGLVNGTLTDGTAQNLGANAVLTKNITVNEDLLASIKTDDDGNVTNGSSFKAWRPMGMADENGEFTGHYKGIFDGNGYSISGLYVNRDEATADVNSRFKSSIGLFGYHDGVTKNLGILDSYMRGNYCIGGICGYNDGGTIQNCYSAATVCGDSYIGGICGRSRSNSIIENCYNAGYIYGATRSIGGICGDNYSTIESCYNIGIIEGNFMVGGIVGVSSGLGNTIWIKDCYNRGNVIGDTKDIGGIGGYIGSSLVENCYSQATVSGNTNVGGICGNSNKVDFQNAYYDSNLYTGNAIGYLKDATTEKTEGKPSQAFESGEIAYLLQADREEPVWGQTLSGNDVQVYPVLGGAKVYQNITYQDCAKDEAHTVYTYANDQKLTVYEYTLQETKAKEPTCTEAGNTAYYKCNVCGKLYADQEGTNEVSANTVVVPAKGHSFTWIVDREATEQAEGSRHEECSICHEKKAAVAIPKLPSGTQPSQQPSGSPSQQPSEAPSQQPSESPSQKPSEAPSQKPSESPSQKPSGQPSGSPIQQPGQDIKVPAKGTKLTAKGASYQVTSAAEKNPTVVYKGSKKQKASVTIPDTVTIDKVTYKVTSIAANAFKNNKKLKKVVIGKNVTKIGKKAFYGCSKLKKITVKTTKLTKKNVGSQAFKGIHKKAAFKVPKKKISSYRKVFRARGAAKTTKVTK